MKGGGQGGGVGEIWDFVYTRLTLSSLQFMAKKNMHHVFKFFQARERRYSSAVRLKIVNGLVYKIVG